MTVPSFCTTYNGACICRFLQASFNEEMEFLIMLMTEALSIVEFSLSKIDIDAMFCDNVIGMSSPSTSLTILAACCSCLGIIGENTAVIATESTLPFNSLQILLIFCLSKGTMSLPSYSDPPLIINMFSSPPIANFKSSGQPVSGGIAVVAGAPILNAATLFNFFLSIIALVVWVVP